MSTVQLMFNVNVVLFQFCVIVHSFMKQSSFIFNYTFDEHFCFVFRLTSKLPAGRSFVCLDLKNIPQILQQIFAASVLNTR